MAKVTSKLQVTIPKSLAQRCGIRSGDEIEWTAAADGIRITPAAMKPQSSIERRLELFHAATARQKKRQRGRQRPVGANRGWSREDLYDRGRSR
jgi:AbrB family looped-hinge helix DNA binding protein